MHRYDTVTTGTIHNELIGRVVSDLRTNLVAADTGFTEQHIAKLNATIHSLMVVIPVKASDAKQTEAVIAAFTRSLEALTLHGLLVAIAMRFLYMVIDEESLTLEALANKVANSFAYINGANVKDISAVLQKYPIVLVARVFELHKAFVYAAKKQDTN